MMYSEFIERTQYGERYITESMYHDYIEPAYMAAPEQINKDQFCKDFYKLESQAVTTVVNGLIITLSTEEKENFVFGGVPLTNIEHQHYILRDIFLKAFYGIAKDFYRNKCR